MVKKLKKLAEQQAASPAGMLVKPFLTRDPTGELVHAEMPEDAPAGTEHFH